MYSSNLNVKCFCYSNNKIWNFFLMWSFNVKYFQLKLNIFHFAKIWGVAGSILFSTRRLPLSASLLLAKRCSVESDLLDLVKRKSWQRILIKLSTKTKIKIKFQSNHGEPPYFHTLILLLFKWGLSAVAKVLSTGKNLHLEKKIQNFNASCFLPCFAINKRAQPASHFCKNSILSVHIKFKPETRTGLHSEQRGYARWFQFKVQSVAEQCGAYQKPVSQFAPSNPRDPLWPPTFLTSKFWELFNFALWYVACSVFYSWRI